MGDHWNTGTLAWVSYMHMAGLGLGLGVAIILSDKFEFEFCVNCKGWVLY
jgi:hypothetical protein